MKKLTGSQENYLEWVYRLSLEGPVHLRNLAEKVGVRLPSASRAVSGLALKGLVKHEKYGSVALTAEGESVGQEIVRRDQCLTQFLVEVLAMNPSEADPVVHRMEHVIDSEVLNRLEVLVEFALSSPAWVRRLHHRMQERATPGPSDVDYQVGEARVHGGAKQEKNRD